ncbi:MAG: PDZ domain-containing protein [Actinomycetales bacterium]
MKRRRHLTAPSRQARVVIISVCTLLILIGVAFLLPVPYVKLSPGPTYNVIGAQDAKPVILIEDAQTYPVTGELDMTTVMESGGPRGGLTFVDALASWVDPNDAVLPRELLYPDDVTGDEVKQRQAALFSTSQSNAIAAAAVYLKRPVNPHVVVSAVYSGTPSDGVLLPGDKVRAVDGVEVSVPTDVSSRIRSAPAGTTFELTVARIDADGVQTDQEVTVTSAPNPDDPTVPYIGIGVGTYYTSDFQAQFSLEDIGGPSAGLIFTLGIVDLLSPGDLTAGKHVAGTGTIAPDGTVGPIGGIRQKLAGARAAGAELFLMPRVHCTEARDHIPEGLVVTPVGTLDEAVQALQTYTSGGELPACPTD